MYTQLTCPNCGFPYSAEVHQLVDARRTPELKQRLLNGTLNVAVCPQCGAGGQMTTILVYHDPEYQMLLVYLPHEMHLSEVERERMIGRMSQEVLNHTPPEERKAYMLQPQTILNMQTFMEKVLETEGVTKEMIERQKKQAELLRDLIRADKDVQDYFLKEKGSLIDETFFAMLQQYLDAATQMNDEKQLIPLINLRARLMTETAVGQRIEQQQMAVHQMSREAKAQGGLSPQLLAKHVIAHADDEGIVQSLVMVGQGALRYEFFNELSAEIEKLEKEQNLAAAQRLQVIRDDLLQMVDEMQNASRQMMEGAMAVLNQILAAPDVQQGVEENVEALDEAFMYLLAARMQEAEQKGNDEELRRLTAVQDAIGQMVEQQYPPEVLLLNNLVQATSEAEQTQLLDENRGLLSPELVQVIDQVITQAQEGSQAELVGRLQSIRSAIQVRLLG
jgi:hypothetical protein